MKRFSFVLAGLILSLFAFSQGLTCEESEPFCTGTIYTFPAGTSGTAQYGPNYGCLNTQPAPAWYHMRIEDPGSIDIYMYSTPQVDIDFICWGPFLDPYENCGTGLTANKIVDCSYSPDPTETCNIPNGQTGQYYILLITNYSQQPCNITFSQTGGAGSTDCTILPPPVNNNGPLCVGDTLHLTAAPVVNATYYWTGPAGFLSGQQNPVIPNVTMANGGNYSCTITVNGQSSDPSITTVLIYDKPSATLQSGDTTVCIGTPAYILMNFTGWGPFTVDYTDGVNNFSAEGLSGPSDTIFVYPDEPTTYTLQEVHDSHCSRSLLFMDASINTFPYTSASLSGTTTVCGGESTNLTFNLTGTPPWSITYTLNGTNPQTVVANSSPYVLSVNPSATTLYEISSVEDVNCFGETTGQAQVTVQPTPQVNAGSDNTISYGAFTTLYGQVSGGSGNYSYQWQPAAKLVDPTALQPVTVNLTETTEFTLTAVDVASGCQSTDQVVITIEGGPLGCYPTANPSMICLGESTQLQAYASGGSGEYTYTWSSSPSGFNSDLPSPNVSPTQTTTYIVIIDDGYNLVNGTVTVSVNPLPLPDAGDDMTIPHGTYTTLSGSGSGGSGSYGYHWEPAAKLVNPDQQNPVTVNLTTTTLFTLMVTDNATGCISAAADNMTVVVSGDALAVSPAAEPDEICSGEQLQLFSLAGGGTGTYSYSWSSNPPGFASDEANPLVSPMVTTIYTVIANDGFNDVTGAVAVSVNPTPEIDLGPPDTVICVYDTLVLDAGNEGANYQWSNGSTERIMKVGTTGIGFDIKTLSVVVSDGAGCDSYGEITVYFDFSACSGVEELAESNGISVYPNPGNGLIHLNFDENNYGQIEYMAVFNGLGLKVYEMNLPESGPAANELLLDLRDHAVGIYFIKASAFDGRSYSAKFILQK